MTQPGGFPQYPENPNYPHHNYPGPYGPGPSGPYGQPNPGPPPDSNLVWGILTTVLCCLPLGIVSIVKANQVNTLWFTGQYDQAHRAADEAKKWAMWSAIAAGVPILLYIIFVIIMLVAVGVSLNEVTP
ncbi:MAG: CD225/dispanin family protein [Pseudonocardiaceae bacterium]|nr:CD225/dispanin family protein [Pseudonocardiaceae bacterium]